MKAIILLIALVCTASGQKQTKEAIRFNNIALGIGNRAKIVYSKDSNGVFIFYKDVIDEVIAENWELTKSNDSLKRKNIYLQKILRIYIEQSIEVNEAFLKSGLVNPTIVKKAIKSDKEILRELIN